jgi:hypothetical protein
LKSDFLHPEQEIILDYFQPESIPQAEPIPAAGKIAETGTAAARPDIPGTSLRLKGGFKARKVGGQVKAGSAAGGKAVAHGAYGALADDARHVPAGGRKKRLFPSPQKLRPEAALSLRQQKAVTLPDIRAGARVSRKAVLPARIVNRAEAPGKGDPNTGIKYDRGCAKSLTKNFRQVRNHKRNCHRRIVR